MILSHYEFIDINPCNITVDNYTFTSTNNLFEGAYITAKEITVKDKGGLILHGYKSVIIQPNFIAETGSDVIIEGEISSVPLSEYALHSNAAEVTNTNIQEVGKDETYLEQIYPSPTKGNTTINCYIPLKSKSSFICIFDTSGYIIKELGLINLGFNEISLDTSGFGNGLYFYSLIVDGQTIDTK